MKSRSFFVLVLGILCVNVNTENVNRNKTRSLLDDSESEPKQIEEVLNKNVFKQDDCQEIVSSPDIESDFNNEPTEIHGTAEVDIVVEENIGNPPDHLRSQKETETLLYQNVQEPESVVYQNVQEPESVVYQNVQEPEPTVYQNVQELQIYNPYMNKVLLNKEPDEVMETAAGFVPIPIIRNRQKARRPFITRRNFRRNPYPYRKFYFYRPYSFNYPSSLRYY